MGGGQSTGARSLGGRMSQEDLARLQRRFTRLAGGAGYVSITQVGPMHPMHPMQIWDYTLAAGI